MIMPFNTYTPSAVKFASIAPRYEGENTKRAPIVGDLHICKTEKHGTGWSAIEYTNSFGWQLCSGGYSVFYCYWCGGLLPTAELHEGNAQQAESDRRVERQHDDEKIKGEWEKVTNKAAIADIKLLLSNDPSRLFVVEMVKSFVGKPSIWVGRQNITLFAPDISDARYERTADELLALFFGEQAHIEQRLI